MSTSLLYHGFGIRGYREVAIGFDGGAIHFNIEQNSDTFCCSHCGSVAVTKADDKRDSSGRRQTGQLWQTTNVRDSSGRRQTGQL